jgi:hypothetical protein
MTFPVGAGNRGFFAPPFPRGARATWGHHHPGRPPVRYLLHILVALLAAVAPVSATQAYYVSSVLSDSNWHIDAGGAVSRPTGPGFTSCPAGITPNWASSSDPTLLSKCIVIVTNSLGDEVILAGDSWLALHTGPVTDLTTTTRMDMATGINDAGDIVGFADSNGTSFVLPPSAGGPPCITGSVKQCWPRGVLLPHGTSALEDLNTLLSPALSAGYYSPNLIYIATAINNAGQIVTISPSPNSASQWPLCGAGSSTQFILTPCTSGSCPADVYTYPCSK